MSQPVLPVHKLALASIEHLDLFEATGRIPNVVCFDTFAIFIQLDNAAAVGVVAVIHERLRSSPAFYELVCHTVKTVSYIGNTAVRTLLPDTPIRLVINPCRVLRHATCGRYRHGLARQLPLRVTGIRVHRRERTFRGRSPKWVVRIKRALHLA